MVVHLVGEVEVATEFMRRGEEAELGADELPGDYVAAAEHLWNWDYVGYGCGAGATGG